MLQVAYHLCMQSHLQRKQLEQLVLSKIDLHQNFHMMRVAVYLLLLCATTYGLPDDQDIKASIRAALEANDLDLVASLTSQLQQARSRRTVVSVRGY